MPNSLAASLVATTSVGGSPVDTADSASAKYMESDFTSNFMVQMQLGTPASNAFAGSAHAQSVRVSVNLASGAWTASNGLSGTLGGAGLTSFLGNLKTLRNQIETFTAANVFPGSSQVAWT